MELNTQRMEQKPMKASSRTNMKKPNLTKKANKTIKSKLQNFPSLNRRPNPRKVIKIATLKVLINKNCEFMEAKVPSSILTVRNMSVLSQTANVTVREKNLDLMVKKSKMKFGTMAPVFTLEGLKKAQ